jgi:hypothetical protein
MFRLNGVLAGILLASVLVGGSAAARSIGLGRDATPPKAEPAGIQTGAVTEVPSDPPADVLGYYTKDGGKTWTPIKEQTGVAERMPSGTTQEEFMGGQSVSP